MSEPKIKQPSIDLNEQFRHALHLMENTDQSVFITGRAGTGKSTLLSYFRLNTRKKVAVLAPTGVAALNVKGQTIHSFFRFKPSVTLEQVKRIRFRDQERNIYGKLETIIIDEVSMVRADLLDCVDQFLRLNGPAADQPFGGIQMVFIGDLYQLPPVINGTERAAFQSFYKTPYFYSAKVFDCFEMEFVELEKVYRQHDEAFIGLLNSIRNNSIGEDGLALLNRRYQPDFEPSPHNFYVYLTTTNELARDINSHQLRGLTGKLHHFSASIEGDFGNEYLPTAVELQLKVGSQVMMLNNDSEGRWVNGTIGKITDIDTNRTGQPAIITELAQGGNVEVMPFTWEIFRFFVDGGRLQSEVIGRFTQYPLMLAWAITIHKSQGKTFDKVVIDMGRGAFAHGQTYVALSRCTTLDGIILKKPILKQHIWSDYNVRDFLTNYQYQKAEQSCPVDDKVSIIKKAIKEKTTLQIVYLKPNDQKTTRIIKPLIIGEMQYQGKTFLGVKAFCLMRNEERVFRIERILHIEVA